MEMLKELFSKVFSKKKENRILKEYEDTFKDPHGLFDALANMKTLAKEDPKEFQNLVNLFNSLKENTISEILEKMFYSDVLTELKQQSAKEFLTKIIKRPLNKFPPKESANELSPTKLKIWAACNLVSLDNSVGKEFLEEHIKHATKDEKAWLAETISETENKMALDFYAKLIEKDEYLKSKISIDPPKNN